VCRFCSIPKSPLLYRQIRMNRVGRQRRIVTTLSTAITTTATAVPCCLETEASGTIKGTKEHACCADAGLKNWKKAKSVNRQKTDDDQTLTSSLARARAKNSNVVEVFDNIMMNSSRHSFSFFLAVSFEKDSLFAFNPVEVLPSLAH